MGRVEREEMSQEKASKKNIEEEVEKIERRRQRGTDNENREIERWR